MAHGRLAFVLRSTADRFKIMDGELSSSRLTAGSTTSCRRPGADGRRRISHDNLASRARGSSFDNGAGRQQPVVHLSPPGSEPRSAEPRSQRMQQLGGEPDRPRSCELRRTNGSGLSAGAWRLPGRTWIYDEVTPSGRSYCRSSKARSAGLFLSALECGTAPLGHQHRYGLCNRARKNVAATLH